MAVIGGAVVNNGRDTYEARVSDYKPTYALLLYGLNDVRLNDAAITAAAYENDISEIINGLVSDGLSVANIIVGSPPYMNPAGYGLFAPWDGGSTVRHEAFVAGAAAAAAATGATYIDVYQWMIDNGGNALISGDNVHPNDAGHSAIADAFLSVV